MKAVVLENIKVLQVKDIPVPKPKEDQVLLKVSTCSLCRTDAKMFQQGQRDLVLPRVLGHEICGQIQETGEKFIVWPGNSCGNCEMCKTGQENLCDQMQVLGFHCDGGLAEFVSVSKESLFPVPTGLSEDVACMAELLACGINAVEQSEISAGQSVLIYGGGAAGLLLALAVYEKGAKPYIIEKNINKLQSSHDFRLSIGIKDVASNNMQFDVVINATSSIEALIDGISRAKKGGVYCIFSGFTGDNHISSRLINEVHYRQLQLVGAYGCTSIQMNTSLEILARYQDLVRLLIEEKIELKQVPEALEKILSGQVFKFIVEFK